MYELKKVGDPTMYSYGPQSYNINEGHRVSGWSPIYEDKPLVGCALFVGGDEWIRTSTIQEILEDHGDYVKFRTLNSVYEWKKIT